ncbi:hypothetical protein HK102_005804, partial [Quaeritorhiza haematococci]
TTCQETPRVLPVVPLAVAPAAAALDHCSLLLLHRPPAPPAPLGPIVRTAATGVGGSGNEGGRLGSSGSNSSGGTSGGQGQSGSGTGAGGTGTQQQQQQQPLPPPPPRPEGLAGGAAPAARHAAPAGIDAGAGGRAGGSSDGSLVRLPDALGPDQLVAFMESLRAVERAAQELNERYSAVGTPSLGSRSPGSASPGSRNFNRQVEREKALIRNYKLRVQRFTGDNFIPFNMEVKQENQLRITLGIFDTAADIFK